MAERLTCNIDDTKELLGTILMKTQTGERVIFLCEPGMGQRRMQAARVMLTRVRTKQKNAARKRRQFTLRHTIHRHTEGGKRFDAVVVWQIITERHRMIESLEDMLGSGEML